jgi:hypothetical protein
MAFGNEMGADGRSMPLSTALLILADIHTRDDDQVGYIVELGARPDYGCRWSMAEYIEAWGVVRAATRGGAGLQAG